MDAERRAKLEYERNYAISRRDEIDSENFLMHEYAAKARHAWNDLAKMAQYFLDRSVHQPTRYNCEHCGQNGVTSHHLCTRPSD